MEPPSGLPLDAPSPSAGGTKTWRVGTLVYTTGGLMVLFCLLLFGDFAWQLKERSVGATAQLVLRKFQASDFLVGLLIGSIPAAIGMIVGPIISVRSDRHRGRWGRRIPYLLIPLPFVVASMAGLAFSPTVGGHLHEWWGAASPGLNTCVLISFAGFWGIFEVFSIMANAVFGGLVNDVVPQAVIGRFFGLFRMVSLIDGILFNTFIIKHAEEHYFWIFIGTGLFYGIGFAIMLLNVREGEYPPPAPRSNEGWPGRIEGIRAYFRECFAKPYYLWVFMAGILCGMSFSPLNSFSIFYAKSLGMGMETYGHYMAASFACSLVLAYPLGSLADRFHPLRVGMVAVGLYVLVSVWGGLFASTPRSFGFAFLAHTIISGTYFTATASLGQRLYPREKFAQFASAAGLMGAVCGGLLPPTVGLVLDLSHHNYRLTFAMGAVLACLGMVALGMVYRRFVQLGGPRNYVAP